MVGENRLVINDESTLEAVRVLALRDKELEKSRIKVAPRFNNRPLFSRDDFIFIKKGETKNVRY